MEMLPAMMRCGPVEVGLRGLRWLLGRGKPFLVSAVVVGSVVKVRWYLQQQERRRRWAEAGKDVVVLHMLSRGKVCPNLSPFPLKLETYLRMAGIKYQVDFEEPMGPKGKTPWVTLNGEHLADSQLIMEHLGAKYNKDFSSHLTPQEKGTAHAMRVMMDEHFLWVLVHWRYVHEKGTPLFTLMELPFWMKFAFRGIPKEMERRCKVQGIGRHSHSDVSNMGKQDLEAISVYLGEKSFLMGDRPTEADCAVFGMLSQVVWNSPGSPFLKMLNDDFPNLLAYCYRMKEKFWPDWDACLSPPGPASR